MYPEPLVSVRKLSVLAYAEGFTLWHYKAGGSALDPLCAPGAFDELADMFAVGDVMMVSGLGGARVLVVTEAAFGTGVRLVPLS